jgi:ribonuclease P protein component
MESQISELVTARSGRPKVVQLTSSKDFRSVTRLGRTIRSSSLRISCLTTEGDGGMDVYRSSLRIGLVVSKKVGGAVVRNRLRRRLREIFRKLPLQGSFCHWMVVIAQSGAGTTAFPELERECLFLVRKLF